MQEAVKTVTAKYTAENLVSSRSELGEEIEGILKGSLSNYNIVLVSTSIENLDFTDAFTDAVEAKQVAEQNKLRAQIEAQESIIKAEGAAQVLITQANAEAEANNIVSSSITPELLAKMEMEARIAHGWVTVNGDTVVADARS